MPIICYRGTGGDTAPVPCECETFGFPHRTTTGETMYVNTHFLDIEDAWASIDRSVAAGLSLCASEITNARATLAKAERAMVEAGMRAAAFNRAREASRAR